MRGTFVAVARVFAALLLIASFSVRVWADDGVKLATPAFFVVEHQGKRLYLLGSVHLLPPEIKWMSPPIKAAMKASRVFVFEAPLKDADVAMTQFVEKHGKISGGRTLRTVLGAKDFEALEEAAWVVQYPPKLLLTVRPWLAAVYLELYAYLKVGFSPYYGVDHVIEREAEERGATFAYFESVEEQLSYFLKLSRAEELRYLRSTVKDILEKPEQPTLLVNAWSHGDMAALSKLIDDGMADVPQLRVQLLTLRNRKWMGRLVEMIKSDETHFVTVGAGHLVGRDGLVELLRRRGFVVTRVPEG